MSKRGLGWSTEFHMSDFKRTLAKELAESSEYRESYAEGFTNEFITLQIRLIRKLRGISQAQLGEMIESNQGRVSVYENKDYGQWNIETLRRIAASLGCWLKVSIESYGTLLDDAERFSAAGLARPAFEDDAVIRRWLDSAEDFGADVFAPTRRLLTEWLTRDTSDIQPLCDWLQGIGLPGFSEGEEEFQWIIWSLPENGSLRAVLADRLAKLITEREIDVRPIGWRPEVLLRSLFLLMANLGQAEKLQAAVDLVYRRELEYKRESGDTRMGREALSALRTAMERNQADGRWESVWSHFIKHRSHNFLPGTVQAGFDGLIHLRPAIESAEYWMGLADGIRSVEQQMYSEGRVIPGKRPDVIDELKGYFGTIFDYWSVPSSATLLLRGALPMGWMPEAVAAWSCAVFERNWEQVIQTAPQPLEPRLVVAILFEGLDYKGKWNDVAGYTDQSSMVQHAKERVNQDSIRLAA